MFIRRALSNMTVLTNKTYDQAIEKLNSLQSNAATLDIVRKSRGASNARSLPEMREFLNRIGYNANDFDSFNAIHVAGTKGKGSTCAFVESTIRETYGRTVTTGMFTSPHLIEVRERIKINGEPLSKEAFTQYFFEVYDKLTFNPDGVMPQYFRFLTLMAFHVFKMENVDAAIVEVGIGGEYDATNVLERPKVCGISSLGYDHQSILGDTLAQIAWHKSGIFKKKVPAIVSNQPIEAMDVIRARANEKEADLVIAPSLNSYREFTAHPEYFDQIGLKGSHQLDNAALAVALFKKWESLVFCKNSDHVEISLLNGLFNVRWPGRGQIITNSKYLNTTFFLDGAHTKESLKSCVELFKQNISESDDLYLIFNCTMGRNPKELLQSLSDFHKKFPFKHVVFSQNTLKTTCNQDRDLINKMVHQGSEQVVQKNMMDTWNQLASECKISASSNVNDTLETIANLSTIVPDRKKVVLITGSLHLVGACLKLLQ